MRTTAAAVDLNGLCGRAPVGAFVGLGANLGDCASALRAAVTAIKQLPLTQVLGLSSLYRTAAQESQPGSPDYANAVLHIETSLSAPDLLLVLLRVEAAAGRQRPYPNAPRTLDLDLLLYGDARIDSAHLTVPHPRMYQRAFVLVPLAEIAPQRVSASQLRAVADQPIEQLGPLFAV